MATTYLGFVAYVLCLLPLVQQLRSAKRYSSILHAQGRQQSTNP